MRASLQTNWMTARIGLELWLQGLGGRAAAMSLALPLILVVLAAVAVPAQSAERGPRPRAATLRYSGETFKGGPVILNVSRDGKRVTRAAAAIEMTCGEGVDAYPFTVVDSWRFMSVSHRGVFSSHSEESVPSDGETVDIGHAISGRFNRSRTTVTGTWQSRFVVHKADGTQETCDSGQLEFLLER